MTIRIRNTTVAEAAELIEELNAELSDLYPEDGANHFALDEAEVIEGQGVFLVAEDEAGLPVGCGALRVLEPGLAEIKRMYVRDEARQRRVATTIIDALESSATRLGVARVVLELGERQPAAMRLYSRFGFERIDRFGPYIHSPLSVCMAKDLDAS